MVSKTKKRGELIFIVAIVVFFSSMVSADELYKPYIHSPSVPENPGIKILGSYQTDLWPGAATYSYPIEVAPGTNGLQPSLSLIYNHHTTMQSPGLLGSGWTLTENYIERDVENTFSNSADDTFKLFLDGSVYDLVYNPSDGRFHTKIESFLYIKNMSGGNNDKGMYWIVKKKDGTTYRFGYLRNSELISNIQNYAVRWSLDLITDTHSNIVNYTYYEDPYAGDNGTVYPDKILYNNDQSRKIQFNYESFTRPDKWTVYEEGNMVSYAKRLSNITVWVSSTQLVRAYKLNYATLDTTRRSFLSSITLFGSDLSSSLPPITFDYSSPEPEWAIDENFEIPYTITFEDDNGKDNGVRLVDLNRDGLVDISKSKVGDSKLTYINHNGQWVQDSSWDLPASVYTADTDGKDLGTRFIDFNGDGLTDVVRDTGIFRRSIENSGHGWLPDNPSWYLPAGANIINSTSGINDTGVRFTDLNNDGLVDILAANDLRNKVWINNGSGWSESPSWAVPNEAIFVSNSGTKDEGVRIEDINGDKLPDLIRAKGSLRMAWLNNGTGWVNVSLSWIVPTGADFVDSAGYNEEGVRLFDANGDGLIDILASTSTSQSSWINNGTGWIQDDSWNVPQGALFYPTYHGTNMLVRVADINGDGLADLVNGGAAISKTYINSAKNSYLLKEITNNLGGSTSITYWPSTIFNNTGSSGLSELGFNTWVVANVLSDNGMAGPHASTRDTFYSYSYGLYDYVNKEFRGFGLVDEIKPNVSITRHWFNQSDVLKGKEFMTEILDDASKPFNTRVSTWSVNSTNGYYITLLVNQSDYTQDGFYYAPKISSKKYSYDNYGNIASIIYLGDNSTQGDEKYEYYEYVYNTTAWIINTPKRYALYDSDNSTKVRETFYRYDGLGYGTSPRKGELTWEENWLNGGSNPITKYGYDSYGNLVNQTDPLSHIVKYVYGLRDSTYTFMDGAINAKNHTTNFYYNLGTGNLLSTIDSNGYATNYTYDTFGRITKEIAPYDSTGYPTKSYWYYLDGEAPEVIIVTQRENQGTTDTFGTLFAYDGDGNLIQLKVEAENNNQIVLDYFYDSFGRVVKQSNPYLASISINYSVPQSVKSSNYTYDALSRIIKIINPDSTSSNVSFNRWQITNYDENGNKKIYNLNAYDQISSVIEYVGNNYFITHYAYDVSGNLIQINNSYENNILTYGFDTLGRKISENNTDSGNWKYSYDASGNLINQTDARGNVVMLAYDELNRVTQKNSADKKINYTYDKINGTLQFIRTPDLTTEYNYDKRLRKIEQINTIDGFSLLKNWTYDSLDRVRTETMPDRAVIQYNYTQGSQLAKVGNIINDAEYNQANKPKILRYGNGIQTNYSYYDEYLGNFRLLSIGTNNNHIGYSYDNAGNVIGIEKNQVTSITYDKLYRMLSAGLETGANVTNYTYDALGRKLETSGEINYSYYYSTSKNNAPKKVVIRNNLSSSPIVDLQLLNPLFLSINVTRNEFFSISVNVSCISDTNCGEINVSFDPVPREERTTSSDTVCSKGVCTKILYSGIRNVFEDGEWKRVEDVRSLKDKGFYIKYLEKDPDFGIDVIDFNYSSIEVELSTTDKHKDENIPVRIWRFDKDKNPKEELTGDYKKDFKKIEEVSKVINEKTSEIINLRFGEILEFGYDSTTLVLQENETENLEDVSISSNYPSTNYGNSYLFFECDSGLKSNSLIKWNISEIIGDTLISANLSLYGVYWTFGPSDVGFNITAHHTYGFPTYNISNSPWTEHTVNWNERPLTGEFNLTPNDYVHVNYSDFTHWETWNVTQTLSNSLVRGDADFSVYLFSEINSSCPIGGGLISFVPSESVDYGAESRPKLTIVYKKLKNGLVSPTIGDLPFYTNQSNPRTITLNAGQSQVVTAWVNATGDLDTTHVFFVYINKTTNPSISNITNRWNVTIIENVQDTTPPNITIHYPTNNLVLKDIYNYNLSLNVSATDSGGSISKYWYSLNGGTNVTFVPNTTIIGIAGQNNLIVYANDTLNNIGSASVKFNLTFTPKIDDINVSNSTTSYARDDVMGGLVLNWRLDKNYSTQEDSASGLYNGSLSGAKFTQNGRISGAYEFNAINPNEIYKTNTYLFNFQNPEFTYSAWINVKELTNTSGYSGFSIGVMGYQYSSAFDITGSSGSSQGTLRFGLRNNTDASNAVVSNASFFSKFNNTWVHIAGTYDPTTCDIRLYINGQSAKNKTFCIYNLRNGTDGSSFDDFGIGEPVQGGNIARLNGSLDEIRVYNRSLSASEVYQIYSVTNPTFQEAANVTINVTITDEDTPQSGLFYRWFVDGVQALTGFAQNVFSYLFTKPSSVVTLIVNDSNNYSVTQNWNISTTLVNPTIDFTAPTPTNNTYLATDTFIVNFTGIETNRQSGWIEMNNVNYTANCTDTLPYYCSYNFLYLDDDSYSFRAFVNDSIGNQNHTEQRIVVVDTTYPTISYGIGTEADDVVVDRDWIYVNVTAEEENEEKIVFNLYNESASKNGLVLWLALDENKATLIDGSLHGNDAIHVNNPLFTSSGKLNGAYEFDGADDYLRAEDDNSLSFSNNTGGMSACFWANANSNNWVGIGTCSCYKNIFGKGGGGNWEYWFRWFNGTGTDGDLEFTFSELNGVNTTTSKIDGSALPAGEWVYICGGINATSTFIYKNGVLIDSDLINITRNYSMNGNGFLGIGARTGSANENFNGTLDEVRIYNRSLTQEEITALYNSRVVNSSTFTNKQRTINWTSLSENDYYYNVYISDLADNQDITETRTITLIPALDLKDLSVVYSNLTEKIFRFVVNNTINSSIADVSWNLNTSENTIFAEQSATLQPGEDLFVYIYKNYSSSGNYTVTATAQNDQYSDSESINVLV